MGGVPASVSLQIEARAVNLGSGFSHLGVEPGSNSNIGIFAANSLDVSEL